MDNLLLFSIIYTVLLFVFVSLDGTYNITHALFGNLMGSSDGGDYGTGISLKSKGFYVHVFIFALLIALPMLMCKSGQS